MKIVIFLFSVFLLGFTFSQVKNPISPVDISGDLEISFNYQNQGYTQLGVSESTYSGNTIIYIPRLSSRINFNLPNNTSIGWDIFLANDLSGYITPETRIFLYRNKQKLNFGWEISYLGSILWSNEENEDTDEPSRHGLENVLDFQWNFKESVLIFNQVNFLEIYTDNNDFSSYEDTLSTESSLSYEKRIGTYSIGVSQNLKLETFEVAGLANKLNNLRLDSLFNSGALWLGINTLKKRQLDVAIFYELDYSYRFSSQRNILYGTQWNAYLPIGFDYGLRENFTIARTDADISSFGNPERDSFVFIGFDNRFIFKVNKRFYGDVYLNLDFEIHDLAANQNENFYQITTGIPLNYRRRNYRFKVEVIYERKVFNNFTLGLTETTLSVDENDLSVTNLTDPLPGNYHSFENSSSLEFDLFYKRSTLDFSYNIEYRFYDWADTDTINRDNQYEHETRIDLSLTYDYLIRRDLVFTWDVIHNISLSSQGTATGADIAVNVSLRYLF